MSENKTIVPGMGSSSYSNLGNAPTKSPFDTFDTNPYSHQTEARGTIIPGMSQNPIDDITAQNATPTKPIVGFLYSISRTSFGEYWPLQIGPNSIGKKDGVAIKLLEGTVSSEHAEIVVRQVKNGVIAAITDTRSTNGTMINREPIGFQPVECFNGDVITIGNTYELLLILIDATKLNLSTSKDFIQVEDTEVTPPWPTSGGSGPYTPGPRPNDGTIAFDGGTSGPISGGTISM